MNYSTKHYKEKKERDEFELLPEGWYTARIETAEKKVPETGKERVQIMFRILGPEQVGRTVWGFFTIKYEANRFNPHIETTGEQIAQEKLATCAVCAGIEEGANFDLPDLLGRTLRIECNHREYNNKVSASARNFGFDPEAQNQAPAAQTEEPLPNESTQNTRDPDDDIPF